MKRILSQSVVGTILLAGMVACSSHESPTAPIINGWHEPISKQGVYIVRPGDGLYAIAWRYGLDYREIVRINHLKPPYQLEVGQKLYLVPPDAKSTQKVVAAKPIATTPVATKSTKPAAKSSTVTTPTKVTSAAATTSPFAWQWPAVGKVVQGFDGNGSQNKGINIVNRAGTPIKAAAAGQVVYSGSGLPGYGYLIIIKHNDIYLSAYAHNSSVLVKEGQRVKAGEVIARMGNTGADKVMLHFEIRKQGQPIDPESVLPKQ